MLRIRISRSENLSRQFPGHFWSIGPPGPPFPRNFWPLGLAIPGPLARLIQESPSHAECSAGLPLRALKHCLFSAVLRCPGQGAPQETLKWDRESASTFPILCLLGREGGKMLLLSHGFPHGDSDPLAMSGPRIPRGIPLPWESRWAKAANFLAISGRLARHSWPRFPCNENITE